jgi:hypothetical protein
MEPGASEFLAKNSNHSTAYAVLCLLMLLIRTLYQTSFLRTFKHITSIFREILYSGCPSTAAMRKSESTNDVGELMSTVTTN